jgi:hypothetical protein
MVENRSVQGLRQGKMLEFGRRRLRQWGALEVVNGGRKHEGKKL